MASDSGATDTSELLEVCFHATYSEEATASVNELGKQRAILIFFSKTDLHFSLHFLLGKGIGTGRIPPAAH